MLPAARARWILLYAMTVPWAGCGRVCLDGRPVQTPSCDSSGTATLTGATSAATWAQVQVSNVSTCLGADGTCSANPSFLLTFVPAVGSTVRYPLGASVYLYSPTPGTFTLPSANAYMNVEDAVTAAAGQVDLQVSTETNLTATFDVTFMEIGDGPTPLAGDVLIGQAIGTCHIEDTCDGS